MSIQAKLQDEMIQDFGIITNPNTMLKINHLLRINLIVPTHSMLVVPVNSSMSNRISNSISYLLSVRFRCACLHTCNLQQHRNKQKLQYGNHFFMGVLV